MSHLNRLVLLTQFMFIVAGCASAGEGAYQRMERELHAVESELHASRAEDDRSLSAATLERRALIRAVLHQNPSAEVAREAWRAALARYRQAGAEDDPMLMASFAPLSIGSSRARFGYEVAISQRVPLGGKLDAQATLAVAEAGAAQSDYAEARLQLALAASDLYDDYFLAVRSLEIQAQHIALMLTLKENAIAAYEAGRAAAQDALQAEAELARLEYQSTVYETQRDVAVAQINALLHRDPEAALPAPPAELPVRDSANPRGAALEHGIGRRPDIAIARARVRVASARTTVAEREYDPDLTLSTSYNSMWDMPEHRWLAGVSLQVPLQRERRRGAVDEAAALRAAAESGLQSATDAARGEIAVASRRMLEAERALRLYEERLLPIARERIEAARSGFIAAQNGFVSVIEAERSLRAAELELQMARADVSKRRAALDRALGRLPGLEPNEVLP